MYRLICFSFFILFCSITCHAQVYTLSKKTDYSIGIGILTLAAIDYGLFNSHQTLSTTQALQLDPDSVNGFDRGTIFKRSLLADDLSDYMHFTTFALPFSVLLSRKEHDSVTTIGVMLAEAVSLNVSTTFLTKLLVKRPRPFIYNPNTVITDKLTRAATESFISGHTSNATMLGMFSASVFSRLFPESKWKKPLWVAGLGIPAIVGILRVEAGKHFPTDVIAGYGVGALIGYLIPEQHRIDRRVTLGFTRSGGVGLVVALN